MRVINNDKENSKKIQELEQDNDSFFMNARDKDENNDTKYKVEMI